MELLDEFPRGLSVSVVVGENGSGKSTFLRNVAKQLRSHRDVYAISNTVYDKFANLRGITRLSASSGRKLPSKILKDAIKSASQEGIARLRTISTTLAYCGYQGKIGLSVRMPPPSEYSADIGGPSAQTSRIERNVFDRLEGDPQYSALDGQLLAEIRSLVSLLVYETSPIIKWLDFSDGDAFRSSIDQQYVRLVEWESLLKSVGAISGIDLFIRKLDGVSLPLNGASSGQLTLISSFVFLAATVKNNSIVLVDEPENSLHPNWQKEYVEKLLGLLAYREPTIIIATHAPIVVSGAQSVQDADVRILGLNNGDLSPIERHGVLGGSESLEETLFQAFGTVTPANHFVSEVLANEIAKIRNGASSASTVEDLVTRMKGGSFDELQLHFFDDIVQLAIKVERERTNVRADDE